MRSSSTVSGFTASFTGTYTVSLTDDAGATNTITKQSVTVAASSLFNSVDTPVTIDGNATINNSVAVTGVLGNAPATLRVHVDITHKWSGDLEVDLTAPDGTLYALQSPDYNNDGNIVTT